MTLGQDDIPERIAYAREPRKLPAVLSGDEVIRFLEAVSHLKARVALTTAYAAGPRVSEVTGLKIVDIDSDRMVMRIERGKGGKERYVMLSEQLLGILRGYWRLARPERHLFPGRDQDKPIEPAARVRSLRKIDWAVYVKPPFGGPSQVLAYLARYTHRAAIANSRLVEITDDEVAFACKDYRRNGRRGIMRLAPDEFIRRFPPHVLPDGFRRIRHYGFLARGDRNEKLELCRKLAGVDHPDDTDARIGEQKSALDAAIPCSDCGGLMRRSATVPPFGPHPFRCDTS